MVVGVMGILRQLSTLHQLKTLNYLQLKLTLCFPFDTIRFAVWGRIVKLVVLIV